MILSTASYTSRIGEVLGKQERVVDVDVNSFGEALCSAGLPGFVVAMLVDMQGPIRQGSLDVNSNYRSKRISSLSSSLLLLNVL